MSELRPNQNKNIHLLTGLRMTSVSLVKCPPILTVSPVQRHLTPTWPRPQLGWAEPYLRWWSHQSSPPTLLTLLTRDWQQHSPLLQHSLIISSILNNIININNNNISSLLSQLNHHRLLLTVTLAPRCLTKDSRVDLDFASNTFKQSSTHSALSKSLQC